MAKPFSQDLRDRVIEAVERGKMSRRAAGRHYAISESVAIKWLERLERQGSRACRTWRPSCFKLMPHRDFLKGRARRNRTSRFRLCAIACPASAEVKPTPR